MTDAAPLRLAVETDLPWVFEVERRPGYERFTAQWSMEQHRQEFCRRDTRYLVAQAAGEERGGFVILQPLADVHEGAKIKRIVVAEPGGGLGCRILRSVFDWVFDQTDVDRVWLDVFTHNDRARHVYRKVGMREDGLLRHAYRMADGSRADRVVMSLLRCEWRSQASA